MTSTSYDVQLQRLDGVPLAVIRRRAHASELGRLVPECCGLVWNAVRGQHQPGGRSRTRWTICRGRRRCPVLYAGRPSGHDNALRSVLRPRRRTCGGSPMVSGEQSPPGGPELGDLRSLAARVELGSVADSHGRLSPALAWRVAATVPAFWVTWPTTTPRLPA